MISLWPLSVALSVEIPYYLRVIFTVLLSTIKTFSLSVSVLNDKFRPESVQNCLYWKMTFTRDYCRSDGKNGWRGPINSRSNSQRRLNLWVWQQQLQRSNKAAAAAAATILQESGHYNLGPGCGRRRYRNDSCRHRVIFFCHTPVRWIRVYHDLIVYIVVDSPEEIHTGNTSYPVTTCCTEHRKGRIGISS
jgi:hypothetical protein